MSRSGVALRVVAVLIGLRGVGNLLKSFGTGSGIVVLGRLHPPDSPLAPAVGAWMIVLAACLWTANRLALPLGVAYATLATVNVVLFPFVTGLPPGIAPWMYAIYAFGGAAIPWLAVWLVASARRRA